MLTSSRPPPLHSATSSGGGKDSKEAVRGRKRGHDDGYVWGREAISVNASLVSCVYVDHDGFFCFVFSDFFYSTTLLYLV